MKRYLLLITLSSFSLLSCQKNDRIADTEYHADKNIAGEYKGVFPGQKITEKVRSGRERKTRKVLFQLYILTSVNSRSHQTSRQM